MKVSRKGNLKLMLLFVSLIGIVIITISFFAYTDKGLKILLHPLDIGEEIPEDYGQAIVVFGGGMAFYNDLGTVTKERLKEACILYNKRKRAFYISEGNLEDTSGFVRLSKLYISKYIDDNIEPIFEKNSVNTFQNCLNVSRIIDTTGYKEIIIVTSPYHQYRVKMLLDKLLKIDFKIARMHNSEGYKNYSFAKKSRNLRFIFREYIAIAKDWLQYELGN
ncbi:YdcF family protein [Bacteroidota bacterium]